MTIPIRQAWSSVAGEYARNIMPGFLPAARALCTMADVGSGDEVLDVACGPGTLALVAREMGAVRVVGIDFSVEMIRQARARMAGPEAEFIEGNALALPIEEGRFDVVLSNFGAIFAPDARKMVTEMARVIRSGGRAGLTAWLRSGTTESYYERIYRHLSLPPSPHDPYDWGDVNRATAWFEERLVNVAASVIEVPFLAPSPRAAWEVLRVSTGRVGASYPQLSPEARERMDHDMVDYFERYRRDDDTIRWPREALAIVGMKQQGTTGNGR